MKANIEAKTLARIVKTAGNAICRRANLPILGNVLLEIPESRDCLTAAATDLDITIRASVPVAADTAGTITAPHARLAAAAKACKGLTELSFQDAKLAVVNGSRFSLETLPAAEFPVTPSFQDAKICAVTAADLLLALRRVEFAQSTAESRYVLNGVCLEFNPEAITVIATDGRRLAQTSVAYQAGAPVAAPISFPREEKELRWSVHAAFCAGQPVHEFARVQKALVALRRARGLVTERESVILPSKAVAALLKSLPNDPAVTVRVDWKLEKDNGGARFAWSQDGERVEIISKLIGGNFPNWRQVVPLQYRERITFPRAEFLAALQAAESMTTEKALSVKLWFTRNNCAVCTSAPELGEFRKDVAVNYTGREFAIAFNPNYLIDAVAALKDEPEIVAEFTDELSPGVLTAANWKAVVMPMRLS